MLPQAFRFLWRKQVAPIHAGLPKSKVADIIALFQKKQRLRLLDMPSYLIPNWLARDEHQALCWINRIGQHLVTSTTEFVNNTSQLEMAIHDRPGARQKMYQTVEVLLEHSDKEHARAALEVDSFRRDDAYNIECWA